jgi:pectate lyase
LAGGIFLACSTPAGSGDDQTGHSAMTGGGSHSPGSGGDSSGGNQGPSGGEGTGASAPGVGGTHESGGTGGDTHDPTLVSADCTQLVMDPNVNWRQSSVLTTDQEIVACLSSSLGRAVGYGEKALGGYDPDGNSKLTVITKSDPRSVEEQILDAIEGDDYNWIVFDKADFAEEFEVAMYRLHCDAAPVLTQIDGTADQCRNYRTWCQSRGYTDEAQCLDQFFNHALNLSSLPIRNPVIGSNKTIDGRGSEAYFRFSGFAIGRDSSGSPTQTSENVILTHLRFLGAGHTEDHELDPDMIRSTGASHDIWIHKNEFDLTGDSAFDVKVGAHDITMSFNRVVDVLRASLHGSSDSHVIDEQITTTMHHNAFITRDARYLTLGNTGRRVPLIRRGKSHLFNNMFVNYRKDLLSIRLGAQVLFGDNAFVVNQALQEKASVEASLAELQSNLVRDIDGGHFRAEGSHLWFGTSSCAINSSTQTAIAPSYGTVGDLIGDYSTASQLAIDAYKAPVGQDLIDYLSATAGKYGQLPFNSPLALSMDEVLELGTISCQE